MLASLVDRLATDQLSVRIQFLNQFSVINVVREDTKSPNARRKERVGVPAVDRMIIIRESPQPEFMHYSMRTPLQLILLQVMYWFLLVMLMH